VAVHGLQGNLYNGTLDPFAMEHGCAQCQVPAIAGITLIYRRLEIFELIHLQKIFEQK
jgi:hypothetical protein